MTTGRINQVTRFGNVPERQIPRHLRLCNTRCLGDGMTKQHHTLKHGTLFPNWLQRPNCTSSTWADTANRRRKSSLHYGDQHRSPHNILIVDLVVTTWQRSKTNKHLRNEHTGSYAQEPTVTFSPIRNDELNETSINRRPHSTTVSRKQPRCNARQFETLLSLRSENRSIQTPNGHSEQDEHDAFNASTLPRSVPRTRQT